jgi:hypothetical protein
MTRPNRKERRKTNALAKKTKPLARLGAPIFTGTAGVVLDTPDGPQTEFYWSASENENLSPQEIMETTGLHGPFDTEAEAREAARIAVLGPDCKVTEGGMWDPAWVGGL